jgi:hypothetical protein
MEELIGRDWVSFRVVRVRDNYATVIFSLRMDKLDPEDPVKDLPPDKQELPDEEPAEQNPPEGGEESPEEDVPEQRQDDPSGTEDYCTSVPDSEHCDYEGNDDDIMVDPCRKYPQLCYGIRNFLRSMDFEDTYEYVDMISIHVNTQNISRRYW